MTQVNIYEPNTGRQIHNVCEDHIVDAISPWFSDVAGDERVRQALIRLQENHNREEALTYLGIVLTQAS